jgi:hypothetical protein
VTSSVTPTVLERPTGEVALIESRQDTGYAYLVTFWGSWSDMLRDMADSEWWMATVSVAVDTYADAVAEATT